MLSAIVNIQNLIRNYLIKFCLLSSKSANLYFITALFYFTPFRNKKKQSVPDHDVNSVEFHTRATKALYKRPNTRIHAT